MSEFNSFEELYNAVKRSPSLRIRKNLLQELIADSGELSTADRMSLIANRRLHTTLFFEELIRNRKFNLQELLTLSSTSAPGAVAVIKNVNHYHDELSTEEGFTVLRSLLKPLPRASRTPDVVRSKKEIVSALCTREGFFAFARTADAEVKASYEVKYDETVEETIVDYIISVYAQELVLSDSDKNIILARVANSLRKIGEDSKPARKIEFFIRNRFYHRIFDR